MYESHFGLENRPFAATPQLSSFVSVPPATLALDRLIRAVDTDQGIAILSGAAGTGKTQLCLELKRHFDESFHVVFLANSSFSSVRAFLQGVLFELGETYMNMDEHELRLAFLASAKRLRENARATLLIIDESQFLGRDVLMEIRSLASQVADGETLVRTVLAGQLEFEETLAEPGLDAFNQRIGCHVLLETLTRVESVQYIEQRISRFGADPSTLFSDEAIRLIAYAADGLPRGINQLCDQTLMMAFATKADRAEEAHVHEALDILKQLPLHWKIPGRANTEPESEAQSEFESDEEFETAEPREIEPPAIESRQINEPAHDVSHLDQLLDSFANSADVSATATTDSGLIDAADEIGDLAEFDDTGLSSPAIDSDISAFEFGHEATIESTSEAAEESATESIEVGEIASESVGVTQEFELGHNVLPENLTTPTTFGDLTPASWGLEIQTTPVIDESAEVGQAEPIESFHETTFEPVTEASPTTDREPAAVRTIDDSWPEHSASANSDVENSDVEDSDVENSDVGTANSPNSTELPGSSNADEFVVIDRYAFLDSGRSIRAFEQRLADVETPTGLDTADGEPDFVTSPDGASENTESEDLPFEELPADALEAVEMVAEPDSVDAIDEDQPRREDRESADVDQGQIEVNRSDESPLWHAIQQGAAEQQVFVEQSATDELEHWTSDAPDDEESQLGSAVLEVCREAQRAIEGGGRDRTSRQQFIEQVDTSSAQSEPESDVQHDSAAFDESEIELPFAEESPLPPDARQSILREALGQAHTGRSPLRTPKFSQLFTRLRKRQLEG